MRRSREEPMAEEEVRRLGEDGTQAVVDVLCDAFFDYPVMRHVLGPRAEGYEERLATLMEFFVGARILRDEIMLGVGNAAGLEGAAVVSRPSRPSPPEVAELRERTWAALGEAERRRYEAFGAVWDRFHVEAPHLHLNMIGVRKRARGRGLSRRLIEEVHRLSRSDPESTGVTLTTEDPGNVALYKHFGYEVVGHATVAPGLETWGFFRVEESLETP
jgi:ribosomal protein S18 acetylase RimI-like enzyme